MSTQNSFQLATEGTLGKLAGSSGWIHGPGLLALGWQMDWAYLHGSIWESCADRAPLCCGIPCFCLPSCLGLLAQVAGVSSNCLGSQASMGRLLGLWQPARIRATGSTAPIALPRRKPPPTEVSTRDLMGKWWTAGSDFCSLRYGHEILSMSGSTRQGRFNPPSAALAPEDPSPPNCSGLEFHVGVGHERLRFSFPFPPRVNNGRVGAGCVVSRPVSS